MSFNEFGRFVPRTYPSPNLQMMSNTSSGCLVRLSSDSFFNSLNTGKDLNPLVTFTRGTPRSIRLESRGRFARSRRATALSTEPFRTVSLLYFTFYVPSHFTRTTLVRSRCIRNVRMDVWTCGLERNRYDTTNNLKRSLLIG